jgi:hypothetical protein
MDGSGRTSRDTIEQVTGTSSTSPVASDHRRAGPRRSAFTVAVALILATVAALAAVVTGTAGGSSARAGTATTSPQTLPAVQTVGFDVSATLTSGPTTTTLLTGNGAADLTNGDGTTTLTIPALSGLLGSSGTVTAVWQGTNVYVNVPALSTFLGGKSWVGLSLAGLPGASSIDSTIQSYLSDPSKLSGLVTSLGGTVTKKGVQPDGTTEYEATIPVGGIVSNIKHAARHHGSRVKNSSIKPLVKQLHQLGTPFITADAWVGSSGQLTKVSITVDLGHGSAALGGTLPGAAPGAVLNVTVGLTYGVPVAVTIPPASEVDNLGDVLPFLQGLGSLGGLPGLAAHL